MGALNFVQVAGIVLLCQMHASISTNPIQMAALKLRNKPEIEFFGPRGVHPGPLDSISKLVRSTTAISKVDEQHAYCNGIDIRETTISKVQELFKEGKLTSVQLTNCYLKRIYRMNHVLKAVIEVNPDAIKMAHSADLELERIYGSGLVENPSPMLGIPVLIKDNIGTFDEMETTAGSLALEGIKPDKDADVIRLLRKAGAVLLGKSNLSEFAGLRGTNVPNGWSGRGGQTLNAYNFTEDPWGSSTGTATGVAANLAVAGLGTETDGSLNSPASVEGLCTVKGTLGLISTKGVIPLTRHQDCVGPMARTVTDMVTLFDAIASSEVKRKYSCGGTYLNCLSPQVSKKKFRVGIPRFPFWDMVDVLNSNKNIYLKYEMPMLEYIVKLMKDSSEFEVVDPVMGDSSYYDALDGRKEYLIWIFDFKQEINGYLENDVSNNFVFVNQHGIIQPIKRIENLADIIRYNNDHPSKEGYNQDNLLDSEATDGLQNATYVEARDSCRENAQLYLDSLLGTDLDAIVAPAEPNVWTDSQKYWWSPTVANRLAAWAGYPSVQIPAGVGVTGVPFGINFIGRKFTEANLFKIAYAVEQMTKARAPPKFLVS